MSVAASKPSSKLKSTASGNVQPAVVGRSTDIRQQQQHVSANRHASPALTAEEGGGDKTSLRRRRLPPHHPSSSSPLRPRSLRFLPTPHPATPSTRATPPTAAVDNHRLHEQQQHQGLVSSHQSSSGISSIESKMTVLERKLAALNAARRWRQTATDGDGGALYPLQLDQRAAELEAQLRKWRHPWGDADREGEEGVERGTKVDEALILRAYDRCGRILTPPVPQKLHQSFTSSSSALQQRPHHIYDDEAAQHLHRLEMDGEACLDGAVSCAQEALRLYGSIEGRRLHELWRSQHPPHYHNHFSLEDALQRMAFVMHHAPPLPTRLDDCVTSAAPHHLHADGPHPLSTIPMTATAPWLPAALPSVETTTGSELVSQTVTSESEGTTPPATSPRSPSSTIRKPHRGQVRRSATAAKESGAAALRRPTKSVSATKTYAGNLVVRRGLQQQQQLQQQRSATVARHRRTAVAEPQPAITADATNRCNVDGIERTVYSTEGDEVEALEVESGSSSSQRGTTISTFYQPHQPPPPEAEAATTATAESSIVTTSPPLRHVTHSNVKRGVFVGAAAGSTDGSVVGDGDVDDGDDFALRRCYCFQTTPPPPAVIDAPAVVDAWDEGPPLAQTMTPTWQRNSNAVSAASTFVEKRQNSRESFLSAYIEVRKRHLQGHY